MSNITKNILATIGVSTLASGIFYAGYVTGVYVTTKVRETLDGEGEEFEEDEDLGGDICAEP